MSTNVQLKVNDSLDMKKFKEVLSFQSYIPADIIYRIKNYEIISILNQEIEVGYILLERPNRNDPLFSLMKGYCKVIIALNWEYRSKGIGKQAMIQLFQNRELLTEVKKLEALVSDSNEISIKLVTSLGFKKGYMKEGHTAYLYEVV
ncbi:MAG: hypothetical protein K0R72_792 [Clostridia bacterium]|jgi:L-amino acid N-acyltransferase YncA|nr:hypothetical protein [Clostridia bacterium]